MICRLSFNIYFLTFFTFQIRGKELCNRCTKSPPALTFWLILKVFQKQYAQLQQAGFLKCGDRSGSASTSICRSIPYTLFPWYLKFHLFYFDPRAVQRYIFIQSPHIFIAHIWSFIATFLRWNVYIYPTYTNADLWYTQVCKYILSIVTNTLEHEGNKNRIKHTDWCDL